MQKTTQPRVSIDIIIYSYGMTNSQDRITFGTQISYNLNLILHKIWKKNVYSKIGNLWDRDHCQDFDVTLFLFIQKGGLKYCCNSFLGFDTELIFGVNIHFLNSENFCWTLGHLEHVDVFKLSNNWSEMTPHKKKNSGSFLVKKSARRKSEQKPQPVFHREIRQKSITPVIAL